MSTASLWTRPRHVTSCHMTITMATQLNKPLVMTSIFITSLTALFPCDSGTVCVMSRHLLRSSMLRSLIRWADVLPRLRTIIDQPCLMVRPINRHIQLQTHQNKPVISLHHYMITEHYTSMRHSLKNTSLYNDQFNLPKNTVYLLCVI